MTFTSERVIKGYPGIPPSPGGSPSVAM